MREYVFPFRVFVEKGQISNLLQTHMFKNILYIKKIIKY